MGKAIASVTTFKRSGKYYTSHKVELTEEHTKMLGFELVDLIKVDSPSVRYLSPVNSGFRSDEFFHVIDVDYSEQNFCTFLLKPMLER